MNTIFTSHHQSPNQTSKTNNIMTKKQIETYIREDLDSTPRHDCKALASAINKVAKEVKHEGLDKDDFLIQHDLMELLLANTPIPELYTHSYGFHTANGRHLINSMQNSYNTYTS